MLAHILRSCLRRRSEDPKVDPDAVILGHRDFKVRARVELCGVSLTRKLRM